MNDAITSVGTLVAWAKAHPEKSNYGTSSPAFTIATELFKLKTGMPAQPIPYKSSNESMLSVAAGQSLFAIADAAPSARGENSRPCSDRERALIRACRCAKHGGDRTAGSGYQIVGRIVRA